MLSLLFFTFVVGGWSTETTWYSVYGLTNQEIQDFTERKCYRGLYGGGVHDRNMSLLTCPPHSTATSFATLPPSAFLCVVELRNASNMQEAESIVSKNSHLATVIHRGTHELVLHNSDIKHVDELSELCSEIHFNGLADNVIYVATEPIIPQAPMPTEHRAIKRAFGNENSAPDPNIEELLGFFSEQGVTDYVKWVSTDYEGLNTRMTRNSYSITNDGSGGCGNGWRCAYNVVDELIKEVEGMMSDYPWEWSILPHTFRSDMCTNVRMIIPGAVYTEKDGIVVLGAHLDSRNTGSGRTATGQAPGADDNGSGSAINLEIVKAIAQNPKMRYKYGLHIIWFCGEEQGLIGSAALATEYQQDGTNIIGMFNNDMVGYTSPSEGVTLCFMANYATEWLSTSCKAFVGMYLPNLRTANTQGCCSDQQSFYNRGFPAAGIFETPQRSVQYPEYHRQGDTYDNGLINYNQVYQFGQSNFICILEYGIPCEADYCTPE